MDLTIAGFRAQLTAGEHSPLIAALRGLRRVADVKQSADGEILVPPSGWNPWIEMEELAAGAPVLAQG